MVTTHRLEIIKWPVSDIYRHSGGKLIWNMQEASAHEKMTSLSPYNPVKRPGLENNPSGTFTVSSTFTLYVRFLSSFYSLGPRSVLLLFNQWLAKAWNKEPFLYYMLAWHILEPITFSRGEQRLVALHQANPQGRSYLVTNKHVLRWSKMTIVRLKR